jgi:DNA-binding NarL/FixJ family response regulator
MSHPTNPPRGGSRIAIGTGLLVASGLLFVRAAGPWPGDAIVWPAAVAALGALLIWRAPSVAPRRRRGWAARVVAGEIPAAQVDPELDLLTPREREVLQHIARGYMYKEIAAQLGISAKTVEAHVSAVLRKLQLSSRHELSRWAVHRRLVDE